MKLTSETRYTITLTHDEAQALQNALAETERLTWAAPDGFLSQPLVELSNLLFDIGIEELGDQ